MFVFPGARGPTIFNNWRQEIKEAIFLCPEGDRKASFFNTHKDIVIPGLEIDPLFFYPDNRAKLHALEDLKKKYPAYFRGTIFHKAGWAYSKGLRPKLHVRKPAFPAVPDDDDDADGDDDDDEDDMAMMMTMKKTMTTTISNAVIIYLFVCATH